MGTPDFAVAGLKALLEHDYPIVGVITAPDRPAGRGRKVHVSAVKEYAQAKGLHILQPEKLRDPEFVSELSSLKPDIQVVVAFRMLPRIVWELPELGTFNLHASLLPSYRGAAPINWAVINGENQTGVTTFMIDEEIDTGDILLQESTDIFPGESAGELHDRLMAMGSDLIVKTVEGLWNRTLSPSPQTIKPQGTVPTAPKIFREDCRLDWKKPVRKIADKVRGLSPYPGAWTRLNHGEGEMDIKLFKVSFEETPPIGKPGEATVLDGELRISGVDGYIYPRVLQLPGKKRLDTRELLRGWDFPESAHFT